MAKSLNFNKIKKQYMTVTLPDEGETVLMIGTPTKRILDEFVVLQTSVNNGVSNDDALDRMFGLCAEIMSFNKGGIKITKEHLENIFDLEDITVFIQAYTEFITEVTNQKN